LPLLAPVERLGNGTDVDLVDCVAALGSAGQEEDLFLDVGGEVVEPHDLCDACRRYKAEVCELRLLDDGSSLNQPEAVVS
jgi:hypothetical protein